MATTWPAYLASDPGSSAEADWRNAHLPTSYPGARMPINWLAAHAECNMGVLLGGGVPYTAGSWTITTGGTGDSQAQATTAGGGVLVTLASDDDFDTTLDWACGAITPASGLYLFMYMRYQQSNATQAGFRIGVSTGGGAAALPFGTDYTDFIGFSKAIASTDILGRVRGNSGTAADSASLATCVAATEVELGFWCYLHASAQAGSFFCNGTETAFSANQLTQLAAILTSPPTMYWTVHGTGTTGNTPTMTVTSMVSGQSA